MTHLPFLLIVKTYFSVFMLLQDIPHTGRLGILRPAALLFAQLAPCNTRPALGVQPVSHTHSHSPVQRHSLARAIQASSPPELATSRLFSSTEEHWKHRAFILFSRETTWVRECASEEADLKKTSWFTFPLPGVRETAVPHWAAYLRTPCSEVAKSSDLGDRLPKSKSGFATQPLLWTWRSYLVSLCLIFPSGNTQVYKVRILFPGTGGAMEVIALILTKIQTKFSAHHCAIPFNLTGPL